MLEPALYIVPTPIGNMEDITLRAVRTLSEADIIACEDTRRAGLLLQKLNITRKRFESYFEHNETEKAAMLVKEISNGKSVAIISDAGTPLLSDPGYRIVCSAIELGLKIFALPGASALLPALSASGLPPNSFTFLGFPPQKKGRRTFIEDATNYNTTLVFYESTHRLEKFIGELEEKFGGWRRACIAREISKIHEEYIRGTLAELKTILKEHKNLKGEFVVIVEGISQRSREESP